MILLFGWPARHLFMSFSFLINLIEIKSSPVVESVDADHSLSEFVLLLTPTSRVFSI